MPLNIDAMNSVTTRIRPAAPFSTDHLNVITNSSFGMTRSEIRRARSDSHQGHVFPNGPSSACQRCCIDSISLKSTAKGQALPDKLGRGEALKGAFV